MWPTSASRQCQRLSLLTRQPPAFDVADELLVFLLRLSEMRKLGKLGSISGEPSIAKRHLRYNTDRPIQVGDNSSTCQVGWNSLTLKMPVKKSLLVWFQDVPGCSKMFQDSRSSRSRLQIHFWHLKTFFSPGSKPRRSAFTIWALVKFTWFFHRPHRGQTAAVGVS